MVQPYVIVVCCVVVALDPFSLILFLCKACSVFFADKNVERIIQDLERNLLLYYLRLLTAMTGATYTLFVEHRKN